MYCVFLGFEVYIIIQAGTKLLKRTQVYPVGLGLQALHAPQSRIHVLYISHRYSMSQQVGQMLHESLQGRPPPAVLPDGGLEFSDDETDSSDSGLEDILN